MRKIVLSILLMLLTIPTTQLLGQAAVAGSITGVVLDPQGAAITGATVTVTSPALLTPKIQNRWRVAYTLSTSCRRASIK